MTASHRKPRPRGHISVPAECFDRIKEYAKQQGVSISAVVEALTADVGKGP